MNKWNMNMLSEVRGEDIFSADWEKIGSIRDIYYDDKSGEPEWIGVGTGFLGMSEKVVPVDVLSQDGERFIVPYTKDRLKNEPDFETRDDYISNEDERKLCQYFGLTGQHDHRTRVLRFGERYMALRN